MHLELMLFPSCSQSFNGLAMVFSNLGLKVPNYEKALMTL